MKGPRVGHNPGRHLAHEVGEQLSRRLGVCGCLVAPLVHQPGRRTSICQSGGVAAASGQLKRAEGVDVAEVDTEPCELRPEESKIEPCVMGNECPAGEHLEEFRSNVPEARCRR